MPHVVSASSTVTALISQLTASKFGFYDLTISVRPANRCKSMQIAANIILYRVVQKARPVHMFACVF